MGGRHLIQPREIEVERARATHRISCPLALLLALLISSTACFFESLTRRNEGVTRVFLLRLAESLETYRARCGGYPSSPRSLGPPWPDERSGCWRSGISSSGLVLAMAENGVDRSSGYEYVYTPGDPISAGDGTGVTLYRRFEIKADPTTRGATGVNSFWVDRHKVIRYNPNASAGPGDSRLDESDTIDAEGGHGLCLGGSSRRGPGAPTRTAPPPLWCPSPT